MPPINKMWLPEGDHYGLKIKRMPWSGRGVALSAGEPKCVLHTFEANWNVSTLRMAEVLIGQRTEAHFVLNINAGTVRQLLPLNVGAFTLKGGGGNYQGPTVQIEISGYARDAHKWTVEERKHLAGLLELINHRIKMGRGVPRKFNGAKSTRYDMTGWRNAKGIVGHCHAPHPNDHYDPGAPDMASIQKFMREFK